jgi:ribonucleoside-diphosphate reductase alpha chain
MVCLDMDHPDIGDFINWKVREEIKVQAMVEGLKAIAGKKAAAWDSETIGETAARLGLKLDYDFNGEAYHTVSGQNSNNSVRIPDAFFEALDRGAEWTTRYRTSGKVAKVYKSRELWDQIGYAAWRCADPGVQFDSTINAWHTCPGGGRINASNPCVTGDTLVATSTGHRRIADLVGKTVEVINGRGEKALVERVFKTGHKPVYLLRTASGYTLRLTGDHKVQTANRGDVPACELTRDDFVELRGAGFGDDFVPDQFGEVLGAAVGDGCITRGEAQDHLFITLGDGERELARHLHENLEHCKGWLSTGDGRGTRTAGVVETATGVRVGTSVRTVPDRLSAYAVLDAGSENKRFTDAVHGLDRRSLAAVLRGLFTTDGTVADYGEKSQYVSLDSTSLELLRQVQVLLLNFGIKSKLYEGRRALGQTTAMLPDGRGGLAEYPVRQVHSLRISRSSRVAFEREIGFVAGTAKAARLAALNARVSAYADRFVDRVHSLTPCGTEDVYDLTEPSSHHFVANGMVVHNCSEYMFLDNTACNLASINVLKFYDTRTRSFDVDAYEHAIDLWTIVLEVSVLMASYPSAEVARLSFKYRTLGLGYANLGAMLMQAGIAYDSDEARAVCSTLTAILTGRAYRQSAVMAAQLGAFAGYEADKRNMLRVIRNHRLAAHGVARGSDAYEGVKIAPVPIDHGVINAGRVNIANADDLLDHAVRAWDEALAAGEKHGYRNAQVTVIAPTGTIGLLMDCDTTGIEPDFALVKFKKLAGGGYFKIANASVEPALEAMGYTPSQRKDVLEYLLGTLSLDAPLPGGSGSPSPTPGSESRGTQTLRAWLLAKGLTEADLAGIEASLPGVFELSFAFSAWSLGDDALKRAGIDPAAAKADPKFNLLRALGLSRAQIDALNDVVCGRQTVEGAPHLRPEHLSVFDCASKCGKYGRRFIAPEGHIRMMAAAQPFISGAISKTINLPNDASVEDIKSCYRLSWELGLKANALYRDGCKLSQPLSATSDDKSEEDKAETKAGARADTASEIKGSPALRPAAEAAPAQPAPTHPAPAELVQAMAAVGGTPAGVEESEIRIVERPMRRRLPDTRASITHKFNIAGHEGYLTVGLYEDGMPGELFITMAKEGSTIGGLMDSLGTAVSVALQYGVPVESLVNKFTHQRFEPAGMTANRDIPFAKSLVDYIFRWMGMEFIPGYREANAPRRGGMNADSGSGDADSTGRGGLSDEAEARRSRSGSGLFDDAASDGTDDRSGVEDAGDADEAAGLEDQGSWNRSTPAASTTAAAPAARGTTPGVAANPGVSVAPATAPGSAPLPPHAPHVGVAPLSGPGTVRVRAGSGGGGGGSLAGRTVPGSSGVSSLSMAMRNNQEDAPACDSCGAITVRSGTCYKCLNCGASMGCS